MDLQVNGLNLSRTSENDRKLSKTDALKMENHFLSYAGMQFFFKYGMVLCSSRKDRTWIIGKTSHMEVYM